ncbi:MAG: P27 family phage terminase small subunit [Muribaculaceae bacterium]|nr:P27 family phage terminase small subunit [Muribaculaceae bacterium]
MKKCEENGDLDARDAITWRLLADDLDNYFQSRSEMKKEGFVYMTDRGNFSLSPHFNANAKTQSLIQGLLKDLGLTPASRNKMKKNESTEEDSLLEKFWKGGTN